MTSVKAAREFTQPGNFFWVHFCAEREREREKGNSIKFGGTDGGVRAGQHGQREEWTVEARPCVTANEPIWFHQIPKSISYSIYATFS